MVEVCQMFQLRIGRETSVCESKNVHLGSPLLTPRLASAPAFMLGQYIPTSFTVIILFLHSGSLRAGSSFGHTPLCFHNLIGFLRKEGCISLTLPASCCVQQQTKAPPPPPATFSMQPGSFLSLELALLSRNHPIKYLSRESSSLLSLKIKR